MKYEIHKKWRRACMISVLATVLAFSAHQFTLYNDLTCINLVPSGDLSSLYLAEYIIAVPASEQNTKKFIPKIIYPKTIRSPSAKQGLKRRRRRKQQIADTASTTHFSSSLPNKEQVRKNIFMLETSGRSKLTVRQSCAVESAARENSNMDVFLYMSTLDTNLNDSYMKVLSSIPNVRFVQLNLNKLFIGSRLEDWYMNSQWWKSAYNISHLSDAIRFLTLYQKGGIYMDLDVVVIKSVDDLHNCAGMEDDIWVAAGVMAFDKHHFFIKLCLEEFAENYDGNRWGYNGPELFTRVLKRVCDGITNLGDVNRDSCHGVTVLPPQAFYAIPWQRWKDFFEEENPDKVIYEWKDSYLIHVWNSFSSSTKVIIGSKQPYEIAARTYCPSTYKLASKDGAF